MSRLQPIGPAGCTFFKRDPVHLDGLFWSNINGQLRNLTTSLKIQTSVGNLPTIKLKLGVFVISKGPVKRIDCTIKTHTVNFFTHFSVLTSYFLSWPHFLFWVFINTSLSFFYFLTYIYIRNLYNKCQIHSSVRFSGPAFNLKYILLETDQKLALTNLSLSV